MKNEEEKTLWLLPKHTTINNLRPWWYAHNRSKATYTRGKRQKKENEEAFFFYLPMLTSTPSIRLAPTTGIIIGSLLLLSGRSGEDSGVEPPLLPALLLPPADGDEPRDIGDVAWESAVGRARRGWHADNTQPLALLTLCVIFGRRRRSRGGGDGKT